MDDDLLITAAVSGQGKRDCQVVLHKTRYGNGIECVLNRREHADVIHTNSLGLFVIHNVQLTYTNVSFNFKSIWRENSVS